MSNQYSEKSNLNKTKAKQEGKKRYESATPCKKCGSYEKYVSSSGCVQCSIERLNNKDLMAPYRTKEKKQKWLKNNPDKRKAHLDKYNNRPETKQRVKEYYESNKEKLRDKDLQRKYDISLDKYNRLYESQNRVCAICKNECSTGKNLSVDHCHNSNKVRGLLCKNCNIGIGMFFDNIEYMKTAIQYLNDGEYIENLLD